MNIPGIHSIPANRFLLYLLLFTVILRFPALFVPVIDTDEAGHGVCARELLRGGTLYIDYADNKPPLLYWMYTGILWLGNQSTLAVHWFTILWILLGACGLWNMVSTVSGVPDHGRWAAVAYIVGSSVYLPNDMLASNGEQLMNPFLIIAVWALWIRGPSFTRGLVSGIAACAGGLCYQKGWIVIPLIVIWVLYDQVIRTKSYRSGCAFISGHILGVLSLILVVSAILISTGSLSEGIRWNFISNSRYIRTGVGLLSFSLEDSQPHGTVRIIFYTLANVLPFWIIWSGLRTTDSVDLKRRSFQQFLLVWGGLSFLALSLGGRYYGHYFLQIVPSWSALFGLHMPAALHRFSGRNRRKLVYAGIPLMGLLLFSYVWLSIGGLESQKPILKNVADHARNNTDPHERIFVWGYASPVYYYSQRQPASRFVYPQSLAGYVPGNPYSMNQETDFRPFIAWENWPLLIEDLSRKKPAYIYDFAPTGFHYWGKFVMSAYPLKDFVSRYYEPADTIQGVVAYRRKDYSGCE